MLVLKWKSFANVDPEKEYLALISYLPLKSFWSLPKFFKYKLAIQRQLADSEGLIGYSLKAHILSKDFWTLSVWKGEGVLMDFVGSGEHKETMKGLQGHMGEDIKFSRWDINGSDIPPSWVQSFSHL